MIILNSQFPHTSTSFFSYSQEDLKSIIVYYIYGPKTAVMSLCHGLKSINHCTVMSLSCTFHYKWKSTSHRQTVKQYLLPTLYKCQRSDHIISLLSEQQDRPYNHDQICIDQMLRSSVMSVNSSYLRENISFNKFS